jgi:5'(3')-deoxyribonucleotidase
MDDVLVDTAGRLIERYNRLYGEALTSADLDGHIEHVAPLERREVVRAMLHEPDFFADLEPMGGGLACVHELVERYEVFIATAAMEFPSSFPAKFAWLRQHLPFVPTSHIVFCGDKSVLDVDYLIDDTPRHFVRLAGKGVLFSAPHNRLETAYTRVNDWADVRGLFLSASA